jgi:hypothetical protein
VLNGVKAVVVNNDLRKLDTLAYHFVVNFAKDNDLQIVDACILPEPADNASSRDPAALSKIKPAERPRVSLVRCAAGVAAPAHAVRRGGAHHARRGTLYR